MGQGKRTAIMLIAGTILMVAAFFVLILFGAVYIPAGDVFAALFGKGNATGFTDTIVLETRLPMAVAAICCGATLSVAGLMMQTLFHNPLAGPSVLGISSGASFGVAILVLSAGGLGGVLTGAWQPILTTVAALVGGMATIMVLFLFSAITRSGVTLLIVGLMLSYLFSSGIALLNYFSPADEIRSYLIWGLGSFTGLRLSSATWLLVLSILALLPTAFFIKPLNALLMGERYVESVGYSMNRIRGGVLLTAGLLVGIPTAFCGPIGFIGLIVPHLCRLLLKSSNHLLLLPASIIAGGLVGLLCAFIGVLPSASFGILPVNVITPLIGVPVILYLLVNRRKLPYFS